MKVGKKLLSTLLAILMIVSSVSVCFGVLGADNTIANLMTRIEVNYATLADYILAAKAEGATADDKKKVPVSKTAGVWEVELDSSTSSWHWVTAAYAEAAKLYANNTKTIKGINDAIKADVNARSDKALSEEKYNEVLDFFAFGGAENTITLNIGAGFDILQWAPDYTKIPEDADDLQLYTATVTFEVTGDKVTAVEFENAQQNSETLAANMKMVKDAIVDFIGKADTWFNTNYASLDVATLNETVKGISEDIVTYELAVTVGNYEEVWDEYVAPKITGNRKWAEVKQWYKTNIVGYVASAYAAQYQSAIEALFTAADAQTAGADLLESYKLIEAQLEALENQTAYNGDETVNITDLIINAFAENGGNAGVKYYNKVLERKTDLGHKLAEAFANEQFESFVAQFMAMVDTATTKHTYVTSAEAQAMGHKWEESCDGNCSEKCPGSGKVTKADDGTITGYTYTAKDENGNDVE